MRIIIAIVVFFIVSWLAGMVLPFPLINLLVGLGAAFLAYRMSSTGSSSGSAAGPQGPATFSWKSIEVHSEQKILYFNGDPIPFDKINKIAYETYGQRGCLGGAAYHIHIYVDDLKNPRRTMNVGSVLYSGNLRTEENYERLRIALGIK